MDENTLLKAILCSCVIENDKKYLTCADALKIAEELNIDPALVGKRCNEHQIKITACRLGCF